MEYLSLGATLSSAVAYALSFLFSFVANHYVVFQSKKRIRNTLIPFLFVSIFGFMLTSLTMFLIVDVYGFIYFYGIATVLVIIPLSNYVLNHLWTFKERHEIV